MNIYYAHFIHIQKIAKRIQKVVKRYIKDVPEIKNISRRVEVLLIIDVESGTYESLS